MVDLTPTQRAYHATANRLDGLVQRHKSDTAIPFVCLYDAIRRKLPDLTGKRVLELGCAEGTLLYALHEMGAHAYGVDANAENPPRSPVHFTQANVCQTTIDEITPQTFFPDADFDRFDLIYSKYFISILLLREKEAARLLAATRGLAPVQIHETCGGDSRITRLANTGELEKLGYKAEGVILTNDDLPIGYDKHIWVLEPQ